MTSDVIDPRHGGADDRHIRSPDGPATGQEARMHAIATSILRTSDPVAFLRRALGLDALASGATGLLLLLGADLLAPFFAVPKEFLTLAGTILVPYAVVVALVATRPVPPRLAVWAIVVVNALWVIESFAVIFAGAVSPNALGVTFIVAQAVVVALFAELEVLGLRRLAA
jgi:hypothetical protein